MINLTQLRVFYFKDIPKDIKPFEILNHKQILVKSEKIKNIPDSNESTWIANDNFINIIWRMIATCIINDRVGLSAPQIGIFKEFFVMRLFDLSGEGVKPLEKIIHKSPFIVLINPSWTLNNKNEARVSAYESCLSFPGEDILVERPHSITVQYTTLNKNNENYNLFEEFYGWRARIFLHEWEHLYAKTIVDHKK